jgi:hypothetical protein
MMKIYQKKLDRIQSKIKKIVSLDKLNFILLRLSIEVVLFFSIKSDRNFCYLLFAFNNIGLNRRESKFIQQNYSLSE